MSRDAAIFSFILRLVLIIICVNKAKALNRSQFGWGVFAFFFPILALIWIQFVKPKVEWENQEI